MFKKKEKIFGILRTSIIGLTLISNVGYLRSQEDCYNFKTKPDFLTDINKNLKWNGNTAQFDYPYISFECTDSEYSYDYYIAIQNSIIDWKNESDEYLLNRITIYENWKYDKIDIKIHQSKNFETLTEEDMENLNKFALSYNEKVNLFNEHDLKLRIYEELKSMGNHPGLIELPKE